MEPLHIIAKPQTEVEKLEAKLRHVISMEKRASARVRRATTIMHKWQQARRRMEKRIGDAEVRRIINRLTTGAEA